MEPDASQSRPPSESLDPDSVRPQDLVASNGEGRPDHSEGRDSPELSDPLVIKLAELIKRYPVKKVEDGQRPEHMEPGVTYYTVSRQRPN